MPGATVGIEDRVGRVGERSVDVATVARIWRGGCIIRARLLSQISDEYAAGGLATLLVAPSIAAGLAERQDGWRRVVGLATSSGVPVPGFSSALSYYDGLRRDRLPAALIQGLRDYFGAHTYERVDTAGVFQMESSGFTQMVVDMKPSRFEDVIAAGALIWGEVLSAASSAAPGLDSVTSTAHDLLDGMALGLGGGTDRAE